MKTILSLLAGLALFASAGHANAQSTPVANGKTATASFVMSATITVAPFFTTAKHSGRREVNSDRNSPFKRVLPG